MKILRLTLKKKWFDMILIGVKTQEYREAKPYWDIRLNGVKTYDAIEFVNGYNKDSPRFLIEYKGLRLGLGIPQWGAPENSMVYILQLGKIINPK